MPRDKYGPMTLESFEVLIQMQVKEKVRNPSLWEDCAQEARIKVWQILSERPHVSRGYIARATGRRIVEVAMERRPQTGQSSARGKLVDPLRRQPHSLDAFQVDQADEPVSLDAKRRERVRAAVESLSPRQRDFIHERYYECRPYSQLSVDPHVWYRKRIGARDKLREQLKDLAA